VVNSIRGSRRRFRENIFRPGKLTAREQFFTRNAVSCRMTRDLLLPWICSEALIRGVVCPPSFEESARGKCDGRSAWQEKWRAAAAFCPRWKCSSIAGDVDENAPLITKRAAGCSWRLREPESIAPPAIDRGHPGAAVREGRRAYHFCGTAVNINRGLQVKNVVIRYSIHVWAGPEPTDNRAGRSVLFLNSPGRRPCFRYERICQPTLYIIGREQLDISRQSAWFGTAKKERNYGGPAGPP
jgi:hypothetical protein